MARHRYLTAPPATTKMPPGIPYIVGNEAAERFSYYGMMSILVLYMTKQLATASGELDVMSEAEATAKFHLFVAAVYFFPVLGALLSDSILGKYRTILSLSLVYCLGHLALAVDQTRLGLFIGLGLIAIGSGGIKPCVAAHVGDQFGVTNAHLLERVFGWFYMAINVAALIASLLIPKLLKWYGPHVAFGVPGLLMMLATLIFWLGRNKFVHIPPGGSSFARDLVSWQTWRLLGKIVLVYVFVAVFWSLYGQTHSVWTLQAEKMDLHLFGFEIDPGQVQSVNALLILIFVPLFSYVVYPAINKVFPLSRVRKITIGFFLVSLAFVVSGWIEAQLQGGVKLHVAWQLPAYVLLTAAEIMVSVTSLEFAYTQAPKRMKSIVSAIASFSIASGNLFTSRVNAFIDANHPWWLSGANYYLFYSGLMLVTALAFIAVAMRYQEHTYVQDEGPAEG